MMFFVFEFYLVCSFGELFSFGLGTVKSGMKIEVK